MSSEPGITSLPRPSSPEGLPLGRQLVVTQGDPAGIGPELLLRLGAAGLLRPGDRVVADRAPLRELASRFGDWAARGHAALEPLIDLPTDRPTDRGDRLGQVSALIHG